MISENGSNSGWTSAVGNTKSAGADMVSGEREIEIERERERGQDR